MSLLGICTEYRVICQELDIRRKYCAQPQRVFISVGEKTIGIYHCKMYFMNILIP